MTVKAIASTYVAIDGTIKPATIIYSTESGKIIHIIPQVIHSSESYYLKQYDIDEYEIVTPNVILPGLVDSHVHLNEPGRTDWEGFETGTKAAICGGVTTIVDMPLNAIPPTTTVKNFRIKLDAARNQLWCDVAFWGGLVPNNLDDLKPLINCGIRGFKGFLTNSGVDEFPMVDRTYINTAMKILNDQNTMLLFHCELDDGIERIGGKDSTIYESFLQSRPPSFEIDAVNLVIGCIEENILHKNSSLKVHIVHLATEDALPAIKIAHKKGLPLTVETCFHYLILKAENIENSATHFKCCPPIRSEDNRLALWDAIRDGTISSVVSDHSPCTPKLKNLDRGDFFKAWGGISSVGFHLPIMHSVASRFKDPILLTDIVRICCENTAKQAGLHDTKGFIKVGHDADFVIFDIDKESQIINDNLHFKNKLTPYHGFKIYGSVEKVILRGKVAFEPETGPSKLPIGKTLLEQRC